MVVVAVVVVDHTLPGNWDKFVVDIEDNIVVVVVDYKYHLLMNIVDSMLDKNIIVDVYFVGLDHLLDKHALYDYFQYLMFLKVH